MLNGVPVPPPEVPLIFIFPVPVLCTKNPAPPPASNTPPLRTEPLPEVPVKVISPFTVLIYEAVPPDVVAKLPRFIPSEYEGSDPLTSPIKVMLPVLPASKTNPS